MTPTSYPMCSQAWDVDVEWNGRWWEVLAFGVFTDRVVSHLGADPAVHTAIGAGYGLERLAMLRYRIDDIEASSDVVIWCCDEAPGFAPRRPQDRGFVGNIVQAMQAYASGALGKQAVRFKDADRIIAIGSDRMMAAVALARHGVLSPYLKKSHVAIGSINSPMQCMMKEICAQCLQPHVDPGSGKVSYVFSCFNQDQPLDRVDWSALDARLRQNSVQEKLAAEWIDHCLVALGARDMPRL